MANFDKLFDTKQYIGPEPLTSLCYKLICDNLDIISTKGKLGQRTLHKGLVIPSEICDKIIEYAQRNDAIERDDTFFSIFKNLVVTRLKRVKIANCNLNDPSVLTLVRYKLTDLELIACNNLTDASIEYINEYSDNLQRLVLCGCSMIIPPCLKFGWYSLTKS